MRFSNFIIIFFSLVSVTNFYSQADVTAIPKRHIAPAPLFLDPVTHGAADPVLIWNREEKKWRMLYSQRFANTEHLLPDYV